MDKTTEYAIQLLAALVLRKEHGVIARDNCELTPDKIKELAIKVFPTPKKGKKK